MAIRKKTLGRLTDQLFRLSKGASPANKSRLIRAFSNSYKIGRDNLAKKGITDAGYTKFQRSKFLNTKTNTSNAQKSRGLASG